MKRTASSSNRRPASAPSIAAAALLAAIGCTPKKPADVADARRVLDTFVTAEREHRASHGNFWRDRQPKVDRDAAIRALGVDLGDAPGFDFTIEPPDSGLDPVLRLSARE